MTTDSPNPYNLPIKLVNQQTHLERKRQEALNNLRDIEGCIADLNTEIREHFTQAATV